MWFGLKGLRYFQIKILAYYSLNETASQHNALIQYKAVFLFYFINSTFYGFTFPLTSVHFKWPHCELGIGTALWRQSAIILFVYRSYFEQLSLVFVASRSQEVWLFACSVTFCKHVASSENKTSDLFVYMPITLCFMHLPIMLVRVRVPVHLWHEYSICICFCSAEAVMLLNPGFIAAHIVACVTVWAPCLLYGRCYF